MSNAQIQTRLEPWHHARFPEGIVRLQALYAKRLLALAAEELNGQILIEAAQHVSGAWEYRNPCTVSSNDGYDWARGLVFKVFRGNIVVGQAAIVFPRARDSARQHGTSTDRSVAAYCSWDVSDDEVAQLAVRYHNALLSTIGVAASTTVGVPPLAEIAIAV